MIDELVDAWRINQEINLRLLESISDAGMQCTLSSRGGRSVARQFAHLQYVRVYQLKGRARNLAEGATLFESKAEPSRAELAAALEDSAGRIERWLRLAGEGVKGVRPFPNGLGPTLAYLVSHESHHRGNILLTLKQCGEPVPKAVRDGLWGIWSKKR